MPGGANHIHVSQNMFFLFLFHTKFVNWMKFRNFFVWRTFNIDHLHRSLYKRIRTISPVSQLKPNEFVLVSLNMTSKLKIQIGIVVCIRMPCETCQNCVQWMDWQFVVRNQHIKWGNGDDDVYESRHATFACVCVAVAVSLTMRISNVFYWRLHRQGVLDWMNLLAN